MEERVLPFSDLDIGAFILYYSNSSQYIQYNVNFSYIFPNMNKLDHCDIITKRRKGAERDSEGWFSLYNQLMC